MAGANLKAWQIQTGTTVGDIPVLEDVGGGTPGYPGVDASQVLNLSFTQLTDSIADSQVPQSAVTQHQGALSIDDGQITQGGAADGQVLTWNNTAGEWEPQAPATGGSATALDLGDDGTNESSDLTEIATVNDTNSIFTEPTADKLLIDVGVNWPTADTATTATTANNLSTGALDDITEIDGTVRTGLDAQVVTGTAGTDGNVAAWNTDGDLIGGGVATADIVTPSSTDTFTNKTFDANGTGNTLSNVEVADFAASALTGLDTQVVTGTFGTSGNLIEWNADGDAVDSGSSTSDFASATHTHTATEVATDLTAGSIPYATGSGLTEDSINLTWDTGTLTLDATNITENGNSLAQKHLDFNNQTGTSYTLALSDDGQVVEMNNSSANTVTVPPNSTVAFPIGTQITIWQQGAGQTTVAEGTGVTIHTSSTLDLRAQYSAATLVKRATDEWFITGDLAS